MSAPLLGRGPREDNWRQRYLARYEQLNKQGESFFPYTILKDAMASLVLFLVLVALAVFVWQRPIVTSFCLASSTPFGS